MSGKTGAETGVRRVVAAFDAASSDSASLNALAEMAALLQASLELLFVEDAELSHAAGLAPARQINLRTGAVGPLAPGELAAEIRAAEARLRRWLADAAAKRQIRCSIRTVRGEAGDALLLASESDDLLVLRRRPGWEQHRSAPAEPLAVARRARQSVLLLDHGVGAPRAVAVLYRQGAQGSSALALALRIAAAGRRTLEVLLPEPDSVEAASERIRAMTPVAAGHGVRVRIARLVPDEPLPDIARRARDGLLVIGADDPVLQPADAWERLRGTVRSLLLVR